MTRQKYRTRVKWRVEPDGVGYAVHKEWRSGGMNHGRIVKRFKDEQAARDFAKLCREGRIANV